MSELKTVLMIAPYFIPRRRVGSLRPFRFAIHLKENGYQPVVLTIGHNPDMLTAKEAELLQSIHIISVETGMDRTTANRSADKRNRESKSSGFSNSVMDWIDKQTPIDTWTYLFQTKWNRIKKEAETHRPDLIWATGDPWSGLWLGEKLSRYLGKPFVADFRDPWTLANVGLRRRSAFASRMDRRFEKKILSHADRIVFTSKSTEEKYRHHYKSLIPQSHTIYNSFVPDRIPGVSQMKWETELQPRHLNILFLGRFRRLSPIFPILNVLKQLHEKNPENAGKVRIHSFGEPDLHEQEILSSSGLDHCFVFHEPVVPERSMVVLKCADLLLLSTHPDRDEIIPAKLWDYLISGKPILSIAPNPEIDELIRETGAGVQISSTQPDKISSLLNEAVVAKMNGQPLPISCNGDLGSGFLDKYSASSGTQQLARLFDDIID